MTDQFVQVFIFFALSRAQKHATVTYQYGFH